jgi:hypothetical protein
MKITFRASPKRVQAAWKKACSTVKVHPWACMAALSFFVASVLTFGTSNDGKDDAKLAWGQMCKDGACRPAALLYGTIGNDARFLIEQLQAKPEVKLLCLNSIGGNSMGAKTISQWVSSEGYDTCVPHIGFTAREGARGLCASACTYIFSEGRQRYLSPGALFQIHRPSVPAVRWMYSGPVDEFQNTAPPPLLVKLVEPVVDFLVQSTRWTLPWELPPSKPHQRLSQEAAATPSYLLRTVPPATLLEWGVLTVPAESEVVFKKTQTR